MPAAPKFKTEEFANLLKTHELWTEFIAIREHLMTAGKPRKLAYDAARVQILPKLEAAIRVANGESPEVAALTALPITPSPIPEKLKNEKREIVEKVGAARRTDEGAKQGLIEAGRGKSASQRKMVDWVASNLLRSLPDVDPAGVPNEAAVGLLLYAKSDPEQFWRDIWSKGLQRLSEGTDNADQGAAERSFEDVLATVERQVEETLDAEA